MLYSERYKGINLYFCGRVALLLQLVIYEEREVQYYENFLVGFSR